MSENRIDSFVQEISSKEFFDRSYKNYKERIEKLRHERGSDENNPTERLHQEPNQTS